MLVACWSAKGGAGTSVVAAALALLAARRSSRGAVFADLAGDGPAILGVTEPESPGLSGWLSAGHDVPADALSRIEVPVGHGLTLLPRGTGRLAGPERAGVLASLLSAGTRPAVADCGSTLDPAATALAHRADASYLVTRPCFLALRRARRASLTATGVILVREEGRALTRQDVEEATGAPVVAEVPLDPRVATTVDAGLFARTLPRSLARSLRHVA
jgi:MinD-like ATPase involved in chromosome partitioning or flagellar assembly